MIYCKVVAGLVVDRALFEGEMPLDWPERDKWAQSDEAQIGWSHDGQVFRPPPPVPLPAVTVADVKAEAHRRIVAIMPEYHQRNLTDFAIKAVQDHGANPSLWPSDVKAINDDARAKWAAIKAIRAKSDQIEAMTPIPADFAADSYWQ